MKNRYKPIRIVILDLYEGVVNQGIDALYRIIDSIKHLKDIEIEVKRFEVRKNNEIPGLDFDIYLSSGGPGSPIDTNQIWEKDYFEWVDDICRYNESVENESKKFVFFICHSFQLACRHFNLAHVSKRSKNAFGIYPISLTMEGKKDLIFSGMSDEIWAVDSRDYQATLPDMAQLQKFGATILATETVGIQENAIMAIRFNRYMAGTQFHPEANDEGLMRYMNHPESKLKILSENGEQVWAETMEKLRNPEGIKKTYATVLPLFIMDSIDQSCQIKVDHDL